MRVIKFRGYNRKNNQWLYGSHVKNRGAHFVCPDEFAEEKTWEDYEVDPESVGQFTGMVDELSNEVYEGDVVKIRESMGCISCIVVYYEGSFCVATDEEYKHLLNGEHPYLNDYAHMTLLNEWAETGTLRVVTKRYQIQSK